MGKLLTIATREAVDIGGTRWTVREAGVKDVPGSAGRTRCLIFESLTRCTRLWSYPAAWRTMSDAQLLQILEEPRKVD